MNNESKRGYYLEVLNKSNFESGLAVFLRAMGIASDEVRAQLSYYIKYYYDSNSFYSVGVKSSNDEAIIGYGGLKLFDKFAWICHLGTDERHQRQGVGQMIMNHLLTRSKKLGYTTVELAATPKGEGLYRQLGFIGEFRLVGYNVTGIKGETNQKMETLDKIPRWVIEWDNEVFGADRRDVLLADFYKDMKIVVSEKNGYGFVYKKRIGPIVALDETIAVEVIKKSYAIGGRDLIVPQLPSLERNLAIETDCSKIIHLDNLKMYYGLKP
ncbi:MAG TPA: GNAT family N-acetyltransferase, partial [Candidatus Hodarchaeales archaeon]|nr:GNAT family N-acetyltransferase [Candidatus Hodarchaeales archaeon]